MPAITLVHLTAVTKLLWSSLLLTISAQDVCKTSSEPNPIAQQYPDTVTGTINGTLAIVPVALAAARLLIPPQYAILERAYRALLPSFPDGMYPVLLQAVLDHDIQVAPYGINVPDFQRIGWSFPFVDLLGDGFSSFTWAPALMVSAAADMAINGSRAYGTAVFPASFDPGCDAYGRLPGSGGAATTTFTGTATDGSAHVALQFAPLAPGAASPFPVAFFQNITNQPVFADGTRCDRQIRLYNSTLSQERFAPVPVQGTVVANLPPVDISAGVGGVFGVLVDTPFAEYNGLDCQSLRGYAGTGAGD